MTVAMLFVICYAYPLWDEFSKMTKGTYIDKFTIVYEYNVNCVNKM